MKNIIKYAALIALAMVLMASSYIVEAEKELSSSPSASMAHRIINEASSVTWEGSKITGGKHVGSLDIKESSLYFDGSKLAGGSFVIDMTSIKNTDLDAGSAKKLEGHLKSDDFFGVSTFSTSTFNITEVKPGDKENEYSVTGDLTIKSTTLPISFPVMINWEANRAVATAEIAVNRADFDVRYGSGRFFDGLGDKAIKDEFTLDVSIVSEIASN